VPSPSAEPPEPAAAPGEADGGREEDQDEAAAQAALIVGLIRHWAQAFAPGFLPPAPTAGDPTEPARPDACAGCPLGQLAGVIRGADPEVTGHLTDALAALLRAGRALHRTVDR